MAKAQRNAKREHRIQEEIIVDKDTREAVTDWHYWVDQGYLL